MSIAGRVYTKMLPTFQQGLKKGKNCLKQIHILIRLLEAYHQLQLPLLATFENFSKVFDSFDRKALFKILSYYRIPRKITDAITAIYTNSSSRVRLGNHLSQAFYRCSSRRCTCSISVHHSGWINSLTDRWVTRAKNTCWKYWRKSFWFRLCWQYCDSWGDWHYCCRTLWQPTKQC